MILYQTLIAYLIGSIPFGLLLTKLITGKDIRTIGSGNIGATNVLRTGNKVIAGLTLALDLLKGSFAIWLLQNAVAPEEIYYIAGAVLIGHMYPVWLGFKGGKGVATFLGVLLALNWHIAATVVVVWLVVAYLTKYSSLAAIIAILTLPILAYFMSGVNFAIFAFALGALVVYKHKNNIQRLMSGKESKIGFNAKKPRK